MPKLKVEFSGFDAVLEKLKKLEGDVVKTTEKALVETHRIVTEETKPAIARHKRSGRTGQSLVDTPKVKWSGQTASVGVGFSIKDGGLPSIFLMYGTPRMKKDQKLYNAIFGSASRKKIHEAQERIFYEEVRSISK